MVWYNIRIWVYGLIHKDNKDKLPPAPTTGKKIVKVDINTDEVLAEYINITKGAEEEGIPRTRLTKC